MEPTNDGGLAFPMASSDGYAQCGMTIRDYFAGQALATLAKCIADERVAAEWCYGMADAMIAARENKPLDPETTSSP